MDALQVTNHGRTTFRGLPFELRQEIYDLCVVPGTVFVRWRDGEQSRDVRFRDGPQSDTYCRPQTQIFLVSKWMRDEAMLHYLANNTFYLMGYDVTLPYTSFIPAVPTDAMGQDIKKLSIALDWKAVDLNVEMDRLISKVGDYDRWTTPDTRMKDW